MNVEASSSSAATTATAEAGNSKNTQNKSASKGTEDNSFEKELKNVGSDDKVKEEGNIASKDSKDKVSISEIVGKNDNNILNENPDDLFSNLNTSINFTDFKYHNEGQALLARNIQELINTKGLISANTLHLEHTDSDYKSLKTSISYNNSIEMSDDDALFFVDLVKNTDNMSMQNIAQQVQLAADTNADKVQKNIQVSSVLMEKLSESLKTNQPFRIDFDKDVSVIIKVNKDGSLMANFIPGDKAVEQYLKNNISILKQRFDEQDLPYSDLSYSNSRQQQEEQRRNKNNKEK